MLKLLKSLLHAKRRSAGLDIGFGAPQIHRADSWVDTITPWWCHGNL